MKEISNWSGFPIHGDVAEIEAIISTPGLITLDKNDIVSILEAGSEAFIVSDNGTSLEAALETTLNNLHICKESITDLAIALWCGSTNVPMTAFGAISEFTSLLNPDVNMVWGVFSDISLGDTFKVVIIGNVKRE